MGVGEKSAFLDEVAKRAGMGVGSLVSTLTEQANRGDQASLAILQDYQADKSIVATKLGEWSKASEQRADDTIELTRKNRAGVSDSRLEEIVKMDGGAEGFKIAQGSGGSGPGEGEEGSEEEPSPFDKDRDRLNKQLDRLENESNEPEIIAKRRAVMESPKFQAWMQERGLTDPNVAFKMLMKEARPAVKQEKNANKAIARGIREGAGEGQAASPFQAKAPREMSAFMPTQIKDTLTGEDDRQAAQASASRSLESAEEKRRRMEREKIQSELAQTPV
jgi:hypothetical protein